jgi:hypothetical protein
MSAAYFVLIGCYVNGFLSQLKSQCDRLTVSPHVKSSRKRSRFNVRPCGMLSLCWASAPIQCLGAYSYKKATNCRNQERNLAFSKPFTSILNMNMYTLQFITFLFGNLPIATLARVHANSSSVSASLATGQDCAAETICIDGVNECGEGWGT